MVDCVVSYAQGHGICDPWEEKEGARLNVQRQECHYRCFEFFELTEE